MENCGGGGSRLLFALAETVREDEVYAVHLARLEVLKSVVSLDIPDQGRRCALALSGRAQPKFGLESIGFPVVDDL